MIPVVEPGGVLQLTWVSSVAPDGAPSVIVEDRAGTVVSTVTAVSSDSTHYYAIIGAPATEGLYTARWEAKKTFSGSQYTHKRALLFKVEAVRPVV